MYNFNFYNASKKQLTGISELQQLLSFSVNANGFPVEIQKISHGLKIVKESSSAIIQFSEENTLFRCLFLLIDSMENETAVISQNCSFREFSMMLDQSRNAVQNVPTIKSMIRHLAIMGYTSIMLYTEDLLKVENEPYFGYMRGAFTKEEITEIDNYCILFGLELIPCIQALAHINQIARYSDYEKIIDFGDILLVGDKRTYELLDNIFKAISNSFSSKKINIGLDEAHMLGLGKYLDKYGYHERFEIMLEHLNHVIKICEKYGFSPEMWSDMFFRLIFKGEYYEQDMSKAEELFEKIPKNVKLIYWDYYSTDFDRYDSMLRNHLKISDKIGFAGGAWKWLGYTPQNNHSIRTGTPAIAACKKNKINSFSVTSWGDNGAEASVYSNLPAIYFYAENAYSDNPKMDGFKTLTGLNFEEFMKIDLPNIITGKSDEHNNSSKFFLFNDILTGAFDSLVPENISEIYTHHENSLRNIANSSPNYGYIFKTLEKLCSVLKIKANLGNNLKAAYDAKDITKLKRIGEFEIPKLINLVEEFLNSLEYQWHRENKSFGYEVQLIRIGGLIARLKYTSNRLTAYCNSEIPEIEELEESRLPFGYFKDTELNSLTFNLWSTTATTAIL